MYTTDNENKVLCNSDLYPRIAIIGGGIGGLTLARILQVHGIRAIVYEREASAESRPQGGTLDMHAGSGQVALKAAELFDEFERFARYEGQDFRLMDKTGKIYIDEVTGPEEKNRPEIDRSSLRKMLIDSLDEDTIRWGSYVKSVRKEQEDKTRYTIQLEDGQEETFDLLVGADGAWSRIRSLLSDANPIYTGVSFVELRLSEVDKLHPEQAKLVGMGSMFALADNKGLLAQRNGDGSIRIYAALRSEEDYLGKKDFSNPSAIRTMLLELLQDWDDSLLNLIRHCDDDYIVPRPIYSLPIDHSWKTVPGVTLLGDAAHVMSPFAGEGANLAMLDAVDLASAIVKTAKDKQSLAISLKEYEASMLERASKASAESARNLDICISSTAPHEFAQLMQQYSQQ